MSFPEDRQRIGLLSRALAWLLLITSSFAAIGVFNDFYDSKPWTWPLPDTLILVGGLPFILLASAYVAIVGRQPRWMTRIEHAHDRRSAAFEGPIVTFVRGIIFRVSFLMLVISALGLGIYCGIFDERILGLVFLVMALSAIWALAQLWRHFRAKRARRDL
jgi:hypothetical protein